MNGKTIRNIHFSSHFNNSNEFDIVCTISILLSYSLLLPILFIFSFFMKFICHLFIIFLLKICNLSTFHSPLHSWIFIMGIYIYIFFVRSLSLLLCHISRWSLIYAWNSIQFILCSIDILKAYNQWRRTKNRKLFFFTWIVPSNLDHMDIYSTSKSIFKWNYDVSFRYFIKLHFILLKFYFFYCLKRKQFT